MIDYGFGVTLGPLDRDIAIAARHWRNTPEIMRWCRQRRPVSDAEQMKWYERQTNDPTIQMYLVVDPQGLPTGVCGLTDIDPWNRRAEFSLYIRPDSQGMGLGRAALQTLFCHGFKELGLRLIWGETFFGNPAESLFQKIGMVKEGTRRAFYFKNDQILDAHLYSILEEEWRQLPWSSVPS